MSGLPRPDLPPGPHRELLDRLHEVHHRAGWPSLRAIAQDVGCSPTTVSAVFSRPRLPSWGVLELVVESLGGDRAEFHALWLAAGATDPGRSSIATTRIAGRRSELARLRADLTRHPPRFTLVTGEAGIGKTRVVATAAAAPDPTVLTATSILAATPVPLLPITDVIRGALEHDDGQWIKEALAATPDYVAAELTRLVPELEELTRAGPPTGAPSPHRLFAAVRRLLATLGEIRPAAIVLEDLHWADPMTRDLLEHLLALDAELPLPLVGTWRTLDPDLPPAAAAWSTRIRRLPQVSVLPLSPLTLDETREQIALLPRTPLDEAATVRIHARAAGNPLFVEQLSYAESPEGDLPELLADLLDQRLATLDGDAWTVAGSLAALDRPATGRQLTAVAGLPEDRTSAALRVLEARKFVTRGIGGPVALHHPLLAEAIRLRLTDLEAAGAHRRVASAMAGWPARAAAEVADHWQSADAQEEELHWRRRAAEQAATRLAAHEEAEAWLRVLGLWPRVATPERAAGRDAVDVHLAAMRALDRAGRADEATILARGALGLVDDLPPARRAHVLNRAGALVAIREPEEGLTLLAGAIDAYESAGPSAGLARALDSSAGIAASLGRLDEEGELSARAVDVAAAAGEVSLHRRFLTRAAWHALVTGDDRTAFDLVESVVAADVTDPDPWDEIWIGVGHTDMLLMAGRPADEVVHAADRGMQAVRTWEIRHFFACLLHSNTAEALVREGRTAEAAEVLRGLATLPFGHDSWSIHSELARLAMLDGRLDQASDGFQRIYDLELTNPLHRGTVEHPSAECALWRGDPQTAWHRVVGFLEQCPGDIARFVVPVHAMAARAAADLVIAHGTGTDADRLRGDLARLAADEDAFHQPVPADTVAWAATRVAELGRLGAQHDPEPWLVAARLWDGLRRPQEAAYCRWRAAQALHLAGMNTVATRLLRRAERDAHAHQPLLSALRRS